MTTRQTGDIGEERAAQYLQTHGYTVVARNFAAAGGELDLIARRQDMLVFVEVKTRAYEAYGGPAAAVTPGKQKRIVLAAMQYIKQQHPKFDSIRFDVLCVLPQRIEHIPNAFIPARSTL